MASDLINPTALTTFSRIRSPGAVTTMAQAGAINEAKTSEGAVAITAPVSSGLPDGTAIGILDADGNAAANNVTISGNGTSIDGSASLVLAVNDELAILVLDGGEWRRSIPERTIASSPDTYSRVAELAGAVGGSTTLAGDVTGPAGANTVAAIQAVPFDMTSTPPVNGDFLKFNGTSVEPNQLPAANVADAGTMSAEAYRKALGPSVQLTALDADWTLGSVFFDTLANGPNAITFSNNVDGGSIVIVLTAGVTSTASWPGSVVWPGGVAPTLTLGGVDVFTFVQRGTTVYGVAAQAFA